MKKINLSIKRAADVIVSLMGTALLLPVFLLICLLIKVTMPGPVLFRQERAGKDGKPFDILKFRTMKVDKKAEKEHDFSKDEKRLTPLGRVLRRLKIDELPQLINVLKGDMSLVGPRPTVLEQVSKYTEYQMQRLKMRPGMTGMAQIHGNIALTWEDRIHYDVQYVNAFNILLDLKILLKTVLVIILGEERLKRSFDESSRNRFSDIK